MEDENPSCKDWIQGCPQGDRNPQFENWGRPIVSSMENASCIMIGMHTPRPGVWAYPRIKSITELLGREESQETEITISEHWTRDSSRRDKIPKQPPPPVCAKNSPLSSFEIGIFPPWDKPMSAPH